VVATVVVQAMAAGASHVTCTRPQRCGQSLELRG
jgi:hypothetical protein